MTVAQEHRKLLISDYLAPCLKRHGYKKKGNLFFQEAPDVIKLISLQNSRWTMPETCEFTINLGLYFPGIARALGRESDKLPCRAEIGQIREGIAPLVPEELRGEFSGWWLILPDTNWRLVGEEVTFFVETFGLKWINRYASIDDAKSYMVTEKKYIFSAAFALWSGDTDEARGYVQKLLSEEHAIPEYWMEWAKKNKLLP